MNLRPAIERRQPNPTAIVALLILAGMALGVAATTAVMRLVSIRGRAMAGVHDAGRVGLPVCANGFSLATIPPDGEWKCQPESGDIAGVVFTGEITGDGTAASPYDITSITTKTPLTGHLSPLTLGNLMTTEAPFRDLLVVDGTSLSPDPATQCRHNVRDGKSKIIGTYLGRCGAFDDLTILGFEPVAP